MKISKELEQILNQQICHEYESAYIYIGMSAYYESTPFGGFAHWMRAQAKEELEHAGKIFRYLADRDGIIDLRALDKPQCIFKNVAAPFEMAYAHEQRVTRWLHAIYELATLQKDYETIEFLGWFIQEQVEEEKQTRDLLEKIHLAESHPAALFAIDRLAGERAH